MNEDKRRIALAVLVWMLVGPVFHMLAQEFRVISMRELIFDVSASTDNVVRDINGNACALVKVTPRSDFVFTGPFKPVKRIDKVGEIWLYMPRESKRITIKHPKWGVIRDYEFPRPLEERVVYELRLEIPKEVIKFITDTVTLTHTVTDTLVVEHKKPRLPLHTHALLTVSGHKNGPSYGLMLALMRRHGAWIHGRSNFQGSSHRHESSSPDGMIDGWQALPYYTGHTRQSTYTLTAGAIHYLGGGVSLLEGLGYGHQAVTWQLAESEGGGYVKRTDLSGNRIAAELGLAYQYKRLSVLASATWVKDWHWQGSVGIGINF